MSISNKEYRFISEILWGGSPIDKEWAIGTKLFISESPTILLKYPKLDNSFSFTHGVSPSRTKSNIKPGCEVFDEWKKTWTPELEESLIKQAALNIANAVMMRNKKKSDDRKHGHIK